MNATKITLTKITPDSPCQGPCCTPRVRIDWILKRNDLDGLADWFRFTTRAAVVAKIAATYQVEPAAPRSLCMWCDQDATLKITDGYGWDDWACDAHAIKHFRAPVCDKRPATCDTRPGTDPGCDYHA